MPVYQANDDSLLDTSHLLQPQQEAHRPVLAYPHPLSYLLHEQIHAPLLAHYLDLWRGGR